MYTCLPFRGCCKLWWFPHQRQNLYGKFRVEKQTASATAAAVWSWVLVDIQHLRQVLKGQRASMCISNWGSFCVHNFGIFAGRVRGFATTNAMICYNYPVTSPVSQGAQLCCHLELAFQQFHQLTSRGWRDCAVWDLETWEFMRHAYGVLSQSGANPL